MAEGIDDVLVMEAIAREEGLEDAIQFLSYSQTARVGDFLDLLARDAGFDKVRKVGLTRDADLDPQAAKQSLAGAWGRTESTLRAIGVGIPAHDFFVLPDDANAGRLENLCLRAPAFPEVLRCAEEMHQCATAVADYEIDREKSIVSAYLAMMRQSRLQVGTGAQAGCWNLGSDAFGPLRNFIRRMGA